MIMSQQIQGRCFTIQPQAVIEFSYNILGARLGLNNPGQLVHWTRNTCCSVQTDHFTPKAIYIIGTMPAHHARLTPSLLGESLILKRNGGTTAQGIVQYRRRLAISNFLQTGQPLHCHTTLRLQYRAFEVGQGTPRLFSCATLRYNSRMLALVDISSSTINKSPLKRSAEGSVSWCFVGRYE